MQIYGVESYIGVPLNRRDGSSFGTLCALDTRPAPQPLTAEHISILELLASLIAYEMEGEETRQRHAAALQTAREAAHSRERFMGILGHDLRNPINAIIVAAKMLQEDPTLSTENTTLARVIGNSGRRMARLVSDTLDLTHGQLGSGIPISPEPADLEEICLQTVRELRVAHQDAEIIYAIRGDGWGEFDAGRVAQVISNLLSNALQHGAKGKPVRLTMHSTGDTVHVDVHNHGEPIPLEVQARVFDPFRRGATPRMEAAAIQGLGLGLYIAREIVRAHGGEIVLHSDESGTTFSTSWPRRKTTPEMGEHAIVVQDEPPIALS